MILKTSFVYYLLLLTSLFVIAGRSRTCAGDDVSDRLWSESLNTVRTLKADEASTQLGRNSVAALQTAPASKLLTILEAMHGSTAMGRNWLSGVANTLHLRAQGSLDSQLQKFLDDKSQDGEARYLVFQWLNADSPEQRTGKVIRYIDDPSLELRFEAIEVSLKKLPEQTSADEKKTLLNKLFIAARHPDQVIALAKQLTDLGEKIDQAKHFGFIVDWHLVGPFDNAGRKHFSTVYQPESEIANDNSQPLGNLYLSKYDGKKGPVVWSEYHSEDATGNVDLASHFNKEKGAIVYAVSNFESPSDQSVDVRLGTCNASKLWVNGDLVLSNEVYHAASQIDQYVGQTKLKRGANTILLKICQNEQTEVWAQDWQFRFRICDETGKGMISQDRK